jgi:hypothetical protein
VEHDRSAPLALGVLSGFAPMGLMSKLPQIAWPMIAALACACGYPNPGHSGGADAPTSGDGKARDDAAVLGDGGFPVAIVQSAPLAVGMENGSEAAVFAAPPQLGDTIVVALSAYGGSAVTWDSGSVSDSTNTQYTLVTTSQIGSGSLNLAAAIYYARVTEAAHAITVTGTPNVFEMGAIVTMLAIEYSGLAADPVDGTTCGSGVVAQASSGSTLSTQPNELAIAVLDDFCVGGTTCPVISPSGYQVLGSEDNGSNATAEVDARALPATGTQTAMWTTGGSGNSPPDYVACLVTFKSQ